MRLFVTGMCVAVLVAAGGAVAQERNCKVLSQSITFHARPHPDFTLPVRLGGAPAHLLQIDTGSTGIVVGYMHVGKTPAQRPLTKAELGQLGLQEYIVYSSSGNVRMGHWVYTSLELLNGTQPAFVDHIPVLAVDKLCKAKPGQLTEPFDCSASPKLPVDCQNAAKGSPAMDLCNLGMMGVGFDRGTSMGTSAVNPFLHLRQMEAHTMQRGYVITIGRGVTLGMTPPEIAGFRFLPLAPNPKAPGEWLEAHGCIAITGGGIVEPGKQVCGDILMDTGVDTMFVSYGPGLLPAFNPPIPGSGGNLWTCVNTCSVNGNAASAGVTVTWPGPGEPIFTYGVTPVPFRADGKNPTAVHVRNATSALTNPSENVFVNTSRQLLYTADYLFDASCGRIGFRPFQPSPRTK